MTFSMKSTCLPDSVLLHFGRTDCVKNCFFLEFVIDSVVSYIETYVVVDMFYNVYSRGNLFDRSEQGGLHRQDI